MRAFAISDIHGHLSTLRALLEDQLLLNREDRLFLLGDYVHRGPDGKGVLQYLAQLVTKGYQVQGLFGNHELIWLRELAERRRAVPTQVLPFWNTLQYYIEYDQYLMVHAGFNFQSQQMLTDTNAMLWLRHWYDSIDRQWLAGRIILHGHTPVSETEIRQRIKAGKPAIGIDNGCFMRYEAGKGQLCALELGTHDLFFQENID